METTETAKTVETAEEKPVSKNRPTVLQIKYLMELDRIGNRRGAVNLIADNCGVGHGSVSRYFKSCVQNGYLTEDYEFTEKGKTMLSSYRKLFANTERCLRRVSVPEEDISKNMRAMLENMDCDVVGAIAENVLRQPDWPDVGKRQEVGKNFLENVLEDGNCEIRIDIFQLNRQEGLRESMAARGIARRGKIRNNKRGCYLELTIQEMQAVSRIDGKTKTGHLESLKYQMDGCLHIAKISNGVVQIPLGACQIQKNSNGNIKGTVPVTVTCSVGRAHMPESTALLVFWL